MSDLDFGKTDQEAIVVLKGFAHRVNNDLYNHGTQGLINKFGTFIVEYRTLETVREKQHKANTVRLNIIIGLLVVVAAYWTLYLTLAHPSKSQVDPMHIFHSQQYDPVVASSHKHSQIAVNE